MTYAVVAAVNAVQGKRRRRHGRDPTRRPDRSRRNKGFDKGEGSRGRTQGSGAVKDILYGSNEDMWSPAAFLGDDDGRKEGTPPAASRSRRSRRERWIFLAFVTGTTTAPTDQSSPQGGVEPTVARLLCVHTTISRNKRVAACGALPRRQWIGVALKPVKLLRRAGNVLETTADRTAGRRRY
jgi:hypothetical protein